MKKIPKNDAIVALCSDPLTEEVDHIPPTSSEGDPQ